MADFSTLIASIEATIKQNGVQAITGQVLQDELLLMVSAINQLKQDTLEGYAFYGEALPNGATRVVTQNTFFLAGAGSYTINGNSVTIADSGISVIVYDCVNDEITTYQLFAYDANPTNGSANAVTSGGVHNALAGKQALVPTATEGNLAEFDNAGQVRDAGLATSDLATKDGHYPDLFAGFAGNLVDTRSAGTRQQLAFRQGGGDGVNYMRKILGRTEAWNQIFPGWRSGDSKSVSTNTTNTLDQNNNYGAIGHKYYFGFDYWGSSFSGTANVKLLQSGSSSVVESLAVTSSRKHTSYIYSCNRADTNNIEVTVSAGTLYIDNTINVDLTLLYGAGNEPATVAEFEALHPLGYYAYNAGVLKNNAATGLETTGFNQWDEEWENGFYNSTTGAKQDESYATNHLRSKEPIPAFANTQYYIKVPSGLSAWAGCYAADGSYLGSVTITAGVFTTLAGTAFVNFYVPNYGTTYNNDICINRSDASRNGIYEPYWKREIVLGLTGVTGIPEGGTEADRVTIFPDGLAGVGTAQDMFYEENGVAKARGTMGRKTISADTPLSDFDVSSVAYDAIVISINNRSTTPYNVISNKYAQDSTATNITEQEDKSIRGATGATAIVKDVSAINAGMTAEQARTLLLGLEIEYILATPIVYTNLQNADGTPFVFPKMIEVDNLGTEKRLPEDTADNPQAPFECDSNYSISTANLVRKLSE